MNQPMQDLLRKLLLLIVMSALGVLFARPLVFMFASAFKGDTAIFDNLTHWSSYVPNAGWSLHNYRAIVANSDLPGFLLNSTLIALCSVVGGVLLNSMLAFALARMRWGGRHIVLGIVGALVGGFLAGVLFNSDPIDGALDISSIVVATIGAVLVVVVVGMIRGGRTGRGAV